LNTKSGGIKYHITKNNWQINENNRKIIQKYSIFKKLI
jgi:hypothetical protein